MLTATYASHNKSRNTKREMVYGIWTDTHTPIKHILQLVIVAARDNSEAVDSDRTSVPLLVAAAVDTVRSLLALEFDIQVVAQRMATNVSGDFGRGGIVTSNKRGSITGREHRLRKQHR
jgi:hypothetical protein